MRNYENQKEHEAAEAEGKCKGIWHSQTDTWHTMILDLENSTTEDDV